MVKGEEEEEGFPYYIVRFKLEYIIGEGTPIKLFPYYIVRFKQNPRIVFLLSDFRFHTT